MIHTRFPVVFLTLILPLTLVSSAEPVTLTPGEPIPLRRNIFGVSLVYHLGGVKLENPDFLRLVKQAGPTTVRIPGGTELNFWNWRTGLPFPKDHLARAGFNMEHKFVQWAADGIVTIPEKLGAPLLPKRYLKFCQATGMEPIWGVNVSSASPEDAKAFAKRLRELGAPARHFEFGNECWIRSNVPGVTTPMDFVDRCRPYAEALREVFPEAKIALSGSHTPGRPAAMARLLGIDPEPLWENPWDTGVAQADFADAIVTHHYIEPQHIGEMETISAEEFAAWCFVSATRLPRSFANYYKKNLPGKEVWLTEWNVDQDMFRRRHTHGDNVLARRYLPEHTLLHALFVGDFLLNLAAVDNPVTVANLYTLVSGGATGAILIDGEKLEARPQLIVLEMLRPAVHHCDRIAACKVERAPEIICQRPLETSVGSVGAFMFSSGEEPKYLAIINRGPTAQTIKLPGSFAQNISVDTLTGPELLPKWNNPKNPWPGAGWKPEVHRSQRQKSPSPVLEIPAHSVNLIERKP